jgi:hypothetical protein
MMGIDCDEVSFSELDDYHFYLAGCKSLKGVSIFNHIWDDDPYWLIMFWGVETNTQKCIEYVWIQLLGDGRF